MFVYLLANGLNALIC